MSWARLWEWAGITVPLASESAMAAIGLGTDSAAFDAAKSNPPLWSFGGRFGRTVGILERDGQPGAGHHDGAPPLKDQRDTPKNEEDQLCRP